MKPALLRLLMVFGLGLCACSSPPRDLHAVWRDPATPPASLQPPAGFTITPAQAYTVVREAKALSLKPIWHLYADSRYYYVQDAFTGSNRRRAYVQAVRVDGRTGRIVPR